MKKEELFQLLGEIDGELLKDAKPKRRRWLGYLAAAACLALLIPVTVYAEEYARFNAAVAYLNSLGIQAEDLSGYSRREIIHAYETIEAGTESPLVQELLPPPTRPDEPANVTSDQIRQLTPDMTAEEVMALLGQTKDVGSGLFILLYHVDGKYELLIPFAGLDAPLGVYGETLLLSMKPLE